LQLEFHLRECSMLTHKTAIPATNSENSSTFLAILKHFQPSITSTSKAGITLCALSCPDLASSVSSCTIGAQLAD
jgi:hypothetical protein